MGMKVGKRDGVTIVGGRPMHRAVETKDLPQGVEQVLTLAGLDPAFREAVAADPVAAAASKGIALDAIEAALLGAMPPADIAAMAERMIVPPRKDRRGFMKAVSASVVTMVTGNAFVLCSGCTGIDTFEEPEEPEQRWMTLAGYTCYVCVPSRDADSGSMPVMIALHGEGETCLSSAQRWENTGKAAGFVLVAINWTAEARLPEERSELIGKLQQMLSELSSELQLTVNDVYLSTRGVAASMVLQAAYLGDHALQFRAVNMLGGVPDGDWAQDADQLLTGISTPPKLYYVLGDQDADFEQGKAFADALEAHGVTVEREVVSGSTDTAVLSFTEMWDWMKG